jgi:hypothetical protein
MTPATGLVVRAAEPEIRVRGVSRPDRDHGRAAACESLLPRMLPEAQAVAAGSKTELEVVAVGDADLGDDSSSIQDGDAPSLMPTAEAGPPARRIAPTRLPRIWPEASRSPPARAVGPPVAQVAANTTARSVAKPRIARVIATKIRHRTKTSRGGT